MTWLAVWLVALGLTDVVRATTRPSVARFSAVVGVVAVAALAALLGLTAPVDLVVLAASLVALALWVRLSAQALTTGSGHALAFAALLGGGTWLVLLSGWASPAGGVLGRWLRWADLPLVQTGSDPAAVVLVVGVFLVNIATANVLVRLVLVSAGALRPSQPTAVPERQPSDELRGGRLLGPMERVLILGLGLAGQLTAAGLVIAAKGLIRFPELQAKRDDTTTVEAVGIDKVTEYFLVGSFVSWLIALATLALTR